MQYVAMMADRRRAALAHADLAHALQAAFDAAIDIYTVDSSTTWPPARSVR